MFQGLFHFFSSFPQSAPGFLCEFLGFSFATGNSKSFFSHFSRLVKFKSNKAGFLRPHMGVAVSGALRNAGLTMVFSSICPSSNFRSHASFMRMFLDFTDCTECPTCPPSLLENPAFYPYDTSWISDMLDYFLRLAIVWWFIISSFNAASGFWFPKINTNSYPCGVSCSPLPALLLFSV